MGRIAQVTAVEETHQAGTEQADEAQGEHDVDQGVGPIDGGGVEAGHAQGGEAAGLRLEDLQDMLVDPSHKHWKG